MNNDGVRFRLFHCSSAPKMMLAYYAIIVGFFLHVMRSPLCWVVFDINKPLETSIIFGMLEQICPLNCATVVGVASLDLARIDSTWPDLTWLLSHHRPEAVNRIA